jgi:hypothetical protein
MTKLYFIEILDDNNPKNGCDNTNIYDNFDSKLFENCLDQIKYSRSCIKINDWKNNTFKKDILLLKYANKQQNNPRMYVFNDTDAFQHIVYFL